MIFDIEITEPDQPSFKNTPKKLYSYIKSQKNENTGIAPLLYYVCSDASLPNKLIKYKQFLILLSVVKIPVLSSAKTAILHYSGEPGNFKPSLFIDSCELQNFPS
jgi:hypothetical protein